MAETKIPVGMTDGAKTIAALRELTESTGLVHDVQARNLRIWAMGALDLKSVEVRVLPEDRNLQFYCVFRDQPPENLDFRLHQLDSWCRMLMGSAYRIQVIFGDDVIWDERQGKPWQSPTSPKKNDKR